MRTLERDPRLHENQRWAPVIDTVFSLLPLDEGRQKQKQKEIHFYSILTHQASKIFCEFSQKAHWERQIGSDLSPLIATELVRFDSSSAGLNEIEVFTLWLNGALLSDSVAAAKIHHLLPHSSAECTSICWHNYKAALFSPEWKKCFFGTVSLSAFKSTWGGGFGHPTWSISTPLGIKPLIVVIS